MLAFVDETGDHKLDIVDPTYPLFGLGALLISESSYAQLQSDIVALKKAYFSGEDFIFHSSELKRPLDKRSDPRNACMTDPDLRASFYRDCGEIITINQFSIIACFIRKSEMVDTYAYPVDPYHFAFENILNRVIRYGGQVNTIVAEKRGPELDVELTSEYEQLCHTGIRFYGAADVRKRTSLTLTSKSENIIGLQIIDLILASLARSALGKDFKMFGNDLDPAVVKAKYCCPPTFFPTKKAPI